MFEREHNQLLERLISTMADNTQALADLQTAVDANTVVTNEVIAALNAIPAATGAADVSAGVEALVSTITANNTALTAAVAKLTPESAPEEATETPAVESGETPVTVQTPPPVVP